MKRIKLLIAGVAVMATMTVGAAAPAMAEGVHSTGDDQAINRDVKLDNTLLRDNFKLDNTLLRDNAKLDNTLLRDNAKLDNTLLRDNVGFDDFLGFIAPNDNVDLAPMPPIANGMIVG